MLINTLYGVARLIYVRNTPSGPIYEIEMI